MRAIGYGTFLFVVMKLSALAVLAAEPVPEKGERLRPQPEDRFLAFWAYDSALEDFVQKLEPWTSLQREEALKSFDEAVETKKFFKSEWTIPLVIKDVSVENPGAEQETYRIQFKGFDKSLGMILRKWTIGNLSLKMPRDEALALEVNQVVYLSGEPLLKVNKAEIARPVLSISSSLPVPRGSETWRSIYLQNVKLKTK